LKKFNPAPVVPYPNAKSSKESPKMKKLLLAVVVLLPLALTAQTAHFKFTNDGAFASVSESTDLSTLNLQVSRGSTGGATSTNLLLTSFSFAPDFSTATLVEIVGTIPNGAFSGDNTKSLTLNLDTSTLDPTVTFTESCSLDFSQVDPIFTCTPLAAGTINLTFQENDIQRTRVLAFEQFQTSGPVTIHSHQRSDSGTANVQGTILGNTVSSANAQAGINHLSTLEFTRQ
jgi:hypothetical protein